MSQYLKHNQDAWKKIDHIVVLMLENRSFDNLLGWLYDDSEPARDQYFEGLDDAIWNPLSNIDADGIPFVEQVYVRKNGQPPRYGSYAVTREATYEEDFCQPDPDPGEGFRDTNHQLFQNYEVGKVYAPDPTNLGFVDNYKNAMLYGTYSFGDAPTDPRAVMNCYTEKQTPVLSALAKSYAVCDQWFCSVPSQTWPNRAFVIAATSDAHVNNRPDWVITSRTIFDQLEAAKETWKVYHGLQYNKDLEKPTPFSLTQIMIAPDKAIAYQDHFVLFDDFYQDLETGRLPAFSFLEPQFSTVKDTKGNLVAKQNDQHPPSDIRDGEQLIAAVYNAIVESSYWADKKNILFVVTYDEHGGGYDHVGPSTAKQPIPALFDENGKPVLMTPSGAKKPIPAKSDCYPVDPLFGFRYNRYGIRVPTVLVSPWIQPGTVARPESYFDEAMMEPGEESSRYFDHTSVIASVRNCFGLAGCLTDRDRYAPDLSCVLSEEAQTQPATVKPLTVPDAEVDRESHLMQAISDHLAGRTGIDKGDGEKTSEHVTRTHQALVESKFKMPLAMRLPTCCECHPPEEASDPVRPKAAPPASPPARRKAKATRR